MNKKLIASALGLLLASMPMANANAEMKPEMFDIYGYQNWSYEWVDANGDGGRDYDRLSNNAANIGFRAQVETGVLGLQVGFQCEQFTYWGRNNNYTGWCNRNSKLSLIHETMGELMVGQWLLPYNEIVAGWMDPFYDTGADSHTSIMGNIGGGAGAGTGLAALYYNGGFEGDFTKTFGALTFNRRQEGIVQYVWPNTAQMGGTEGFQFRFAVTQGDETDEDVAVTDRLNGNRQSANRDERIWSTGVSYQHSMANGDQVWLAAALERHDDLSARGDIGGVQCGESDDEGRRFAGRYIHDWGNGMKTQLGAMYEELEYDADDCYNNLVTNATTGVVTGDSITPIWSDLDRDAWMLSGKHTFGNGFDVRFSYMDADEYDCGSTNDRCNNIEDDSGAEAYNIGLFYTTTGNTEFRLVYSEVDNDDDAQYDFGISSGGVLVGKEVDMISVGVAHFFD